MKVKSFLFLSMVLLISCSQKPQPLPQASVSSDSTAYYSEETCAIAALVAVMNLNQGIEYGGFIVEENGKFYYSRPVTNNSSEEIQYDAIVPKNAKFVAVYHTHPDYPESNVYSSVDVRFAETNKVNSYLGVQQDDTIRVFEPGKSYVYTTDSNSSAVDSTVSDGVVIKSLIR